MAWRDDQTNWVRPFRVDQASQSFYHDHLFRVVGARGDDDFLIRRECESIAKAFGQRRICVRWLSAVELYVAVRQEAIRGHAKFTNAFSVGLRLHDCDRDITENSTHEAANP